jgi:hypothetical protein
MNPLVPWFCCVKRLASKASNTRTISGHVSKESLLAIRHHCIMTHQ